MRVQKLRPFWRRRLATELKRLRSDLGWNAAKVYEVSDVPQSTLSRVETAVGEIHVNTVKALLEGYGVTGERRQQLLTLARETNKPGWWHPYRDAIPDWFRIYTDAESEASNLAIYDSMYVNGLAQTEDYARSMYYAAWPEADPEVIERRVELRMERQRCLAEGRVKLQLVLEEWVLQRPYGGPEVLQRQIEHLIKVAKLRSVSLQLMPVTAQIGAIGPFIMMDFPQPTDPSLVYIESDTNASYLEEPQQVQYYSRLYGRLRSAALSQKETVARLTELARGVDDARGDT